MISEKKTKILSDKILMCKGDTKALYKTFNKITGSKSENQMPEGKSEDQHATEFAEFLQTRYRKSEKNLRKNQNVFQKESLSCRV